MRSYTPLYWKILKGSNDNLNESNGIIKNFVALEEKEKKGISGVNLGPKQALEDKKNAACFMVINTIPVTLAGCFSLQFKLR
jgi:hypothetical protein